MNFLYELDGYIAIATHATWVDGDWVGVIRRRKISSITDRTGCLVCFCE